MMWRFKTGLVKSKDMDLHMLMMLKFHRFMVDMSLSSFFRQRFEGDANLLTDRHPDIGDGPKF